MTVTEHNHLIVDAYNANPTSMKAAVDNFKLIQADRKMVILGKMGELGDVSDEEHQKLVDMLREARFDKVWLVGEEFEKAIKTLPDSRLFKDVEEVKETIRNEQPQGYYILIKGSNSNKLFQLPELL
jgi:UDP-N-acetylmuramoyl-tripeptide--D-alanyl-D-alanine ligase